jgi:hypothetical protein
VLLRATPSKKNIDTKRQGATKSNTEHTNIDTEGTTLQRRVTPSKTDIDTKWQGATQSNTEQHGNTWRTAEGRKAAHVVDKEYHILIRNNTEQNRQSHKAAGSKAEQHRAGPSRPKGRI